MYAIMYAICMPWCTPYVCHSVRHMYAMQAEVSRAYKSPHSGTPRRVPGFPLNLFPYYYLFVLVFVFLHFLSLLSKLKQENIMAKKIEIEGLSDDVIEVLNREADRNSLSRNSLLILLVETFSKNVKMLEASQELSAPLADVTQQLNQLTHSITKSNKNISEDFTAMKDALERNNFAVLELVQNVENLMNQLRR